MNIVQTAGKGVFMNRERKLEFNKKIIEICNEFGVENVSIAGNSRNVPPQSEFIGTILIDKNEQSMGSIFEAVMNIGRLWQHSRTVVRQMLNDFEK